MMMMKSSTTDSYTTPHCKQQPWWLSNRPCPCQSTSSLPGPLVALRLAPGLRYMIITSGTLLELANCFKPCFFVAHRLVCRLNGHGGYVFNHRVAGSRI